MKIVYIGFFITLLITSCTDREKKEKALKDLETTQANLAKLKNTIFELEAFYTKALTELEVVKDDLDQSKDFQLLRTEEEREKQIREAAERRLSTEKAIQEFQTKIESLKDSVVITQMKIERLKEFLKN